MPKATPQLFDFLTDRYGMIVPASFITPFRIGRLLGSAAGATGAAGAACRGGRDIYLCRGWFDFPFGTEFGRHLLRSGHPTFVVRYGGGLVDRTNRSWKNGLATVARNIMTDPEGPAAQSVFVGHSQGGLVVAGLAAIAKSPHLDKLWSSATPFQTAGLSVRDLEKLQALLRERAVRFVSMATPFRGVDTRIPLNVGNPMTDTRPGQVLGFFEATGLAPAELIDGNLYGVCETLKTPGRPLTLAVRMAMMMGARTLLNQGGKVVRHDCLLPEEAMRLGISKELVLSTDHWMIAKTREAAEGLVQIIRGL